MKPQPHPVAEALVDWFRAEGRDYPWRRTTDAWAILVSELMLQQTTIATVLGRYEDWMRQFPKAEDLARVGEDVALRSWEGLGYYRRVRSLQKIARVLVEEHGGEMPRDATSIAKLPGIGDYTLGAILSFAYNEPAPLVDANVSRVFARLVNDSTPVDSKEGKKAQWELAAKLLHPTEPRFYNSALMELGQLICTAKKPRCLCCPVREHCRAEQPESLPAKLPKQAVTRISHHDLFCLCEKRGLLLIRQGAGERHEGMYRFPTREESYFLAQGLKPLHVQNYSVTRYKVTRYLYALSPDCVLPEAQEEYIPLSQLPHIPMASPDRKMVKAQLF